MVSYYVSLVIGEPFPSFAHFSIRLIVKFLYILKMSPL